MAKRKKYKKRKQLNNNTNMAIILTIVISVLLAALIYTESGYIGEALSGFLGGMMGWIKYILPIGLIIIAINLACKKKGYMSSKITQYLILIFFVSTIASIFQIVNGKVNINQELSDILKIAYNNGANASSGGGALGMLAAVPVIKMLGKPGSIIFTIGTAIAMFVITFGIDLTTIISDFVEKYRETQEANREEILAQRERQEARREERRRKKEEAKAERARNKEETIEDEQIKINLNGRILDENQEKPRKKYKHNEDDLLPLGMKNADKINKQTSPDFIEGNLFRQEEEKKEDKTKQVLQLEHAKAVEEENYEYPPLELLSLGDKKTKILIRIRFVVTQCYQHIVRRKCVRHTRFKSNCIVFIPTIFW